MKRITNLKIIFFSLSILLIIIFSGFSIKSYLRESSDELTLKIITIEEKINSNDWEEAHASILEFDKGWEDIEDRWTLFINHHEIDNITITIKNSAEFIKTENKSQALSSLSSLKHYLNHIPDMETLSLKNIF